MRQINFGSPLKKIKLTQHAIQPFVLDNGLRVITKKTFVHLFGQGGDWAREFAEAFQRLGIVPEDLQSQIGTPIVADMPKAGNLIQTEEFYTIDTLLLFCRFLLEARKKGLLSVIELKFSETAQSILDEDAQQPLEWQIDETTGFNFFKWKAKRSLIDFMIVQNPDAAYEWIMTIDDAFLSALFDYFHTDWALMRKSPKQLADGLENLVFSRLPDALLDELRQSRPKREYRRKNGPQRHAHPQLQKQLDHVMTVIKMAGNSESITLQLLEKVLPKQRESFVFAQKEKPRMELTGFDKQILQALSVKK